MDVHPNPGPSPTKTSVNSLDVLHLNTRSIRKKMDYIENIAESFHILCFSETHLDTSVTTNNLLLDGFDEPFRKDRSNNGGGIMIYVSSVLKYKRRTDLENPRVETIWIEVKLKSYNVLICCFYRSDFVSLQSLFNPEMQSSIVEALNFTPYVILTVYINIDFLQLTNSQLRDCLSLFSLTNVIDEPTRITPTAVTLIDPVLVSDSCTVFASGILNVDGNITDHKATYVSIRINVNLSTSYYREVWNYKNADYTTLNNLIEELNWASIINESSSVDEACEHFFSKFMEFCKTCIPSRNVLIRENNKPWFTSEIRYNFRLRDRLRKLFLKSGRIADRLSYKRQRNKVNNMKKYAKENYTNNIDNIISNHDTGSSSKTFWQIMGRFLHKYSTFTYRR